MAINLITAEKSSSAINFAIEELKLRDKSFNTIIITPDRMTLNLEQQLFSVLNEKAIFDVNVTTLTRLSNSVIALSGINKNVLTKAMATAIIRKILEEEKNNLKTFKNAVAFSGFSGNIFEIISMFKSCNVKPSELNENYKPTLNSKLHDLKLIYEKYEEFLQNDYTDSFNKLNLFKNLITKELFGNTNVLFLGFDDFTNQAYSIIAKFFKCAKNVTIAATKATKTKPNKNIYLNNVYLNILSLAEVNGFNVVEKEVMPETDNVKKFLNDNLFALNNNQNLIVANNISAYSFESVKNECSFVAKKIAEYVINKGYNYSNFSVAVANLNAFKIDIEKAFKDAGIPVFIDVSKTLAESASARFMLEFLQCVSGNFKTTDVITFFKNPLVNLNETEVQIFEDDCNKFNVKYLNNLNFVKSVTENNCTVAMLEKLLNLESTLKNISFVNFVEVFNDLLEEINYAENFTSVIKALNERNEILEIKQLLQAQNKFTKALSSLAIVMGNNEYSCKMIAEISKAFFEQVNITLPPIIENTVFVGDIVSSNFKTNNVLFVMNAVEGACPNYKSDLSIISDGEINAMNESVKLNPTINFVNKKNKFKCFEAVQNFSDELIFTHSKLNAAGENLEIAQFVKSIINKTGNEVLNGEEILSCVYNSNVNNLKFNLVSEKLCENTLLEMIKDYDVINKNNELYDNLNKVFTINTKVNNKNNEIINNFNKLNNKENIKCLAEVCMPENVSSTAFETYFKCPYKFFVEYALKLKSKESGEISALDYGNILHEYMKIVVPKIIEIINYGGNLNEVANASMNKVLQNEKYKKFVQNVNNAYLIKGLMQESERIAKAVFEEQMHSKFKPRFYEKFFKLENVIKLKSVNKCVSIVGVIDRVDVYKNKFRIIDYKTGEDSFNNFNDVASGKKLQLIVYAAAFESVNNMQPVGAVYLPLKNKFAATEDETLYKMQGVLTNEIESLILMDDGLKNASYESHSINVKTDAKGNVASTASDLRLSEQDFNFLKSYVMKKIESAVEQIESGEINPRPLKETNKCVCDYCEYLGMCKFSTLMGNEYNLPSKANSINELEKEI